MNVNAEKWEQELHNQNKHNNPDDHKKNFFNGIHQL